MRLPRSGHSSTFPPDPFVTYKVGAAAPLLIDSASWRVTAAQYSGSGDWLDEIGAVNAQFPGSGNDPSWDALNTEFDFAQADPVVNYFTMGDNAVFEPGTDSFTAVVRIKFGADNDRDHFFAKKANTSAGNGWMIEGNGDGVVGRLRAFVYDGATGVLPTKTTYSALTWHTVGLVVNRVDEEAILYIDGSPGTALDTSSVGSVTGLTTAATLGHRGDLLATGDVGLDGSIKAACFWNGTALTTAEMEQVDSELTALD